MEATAMARSLLSLPPHSNASFSILPLSFSVPRPSLSLTNISRKSNLIARCSSPDEQIPIEKRFPPFPSVFDINKIQEILPHRYPFLLLDRVIENVPGVTAVGIKNVTISDCFFTGHFPGRPIMPGVLIIEALAQVGGVIMMQPDAEGPSEKFVFAGVDKIRFRKPVVAGDTLVMRMNLIKFQKRFGTGKMEGKAYVGGKIVCEGDFLLVL